MYKKPMPVKGNIVEVVGIMNDSDPLPQGLHGTVRFVNPIGDGYQIDVDWYNGRTLMLCEDDPFIILD